MPGFEPRRRRGARLALAAALIGLHGLLLVLSPRSDSPRLTTAERFAVGSGAVLYDLDELDAEGRPGRVEGVLKAKPTSGYADRQAMGRDRGPEKNDVILVCERG